MRGEAVDPSCARTYTPPEVERAAAEVLNKAYPGGIKPPIEIDILVERHPLVDDLIPARLGLFNVDASLVCKPDTNRFDIFFNEDAVFGRISFSIAHEFGHVVLHSDLCKDCHSVKDVMALHARLRQSACYDHIEREANRFAGAILMPGGSLTRDTKVVYQHLAEQHGFGGELIQSHLCPALAKRYKVTNYAMDVRLSQLNLHKQVQRAIQHKFTMLDFTV
jgi:Zn-dependent peptidase ImmA (M78 family)